MRLQARIRDAIRSVFRMGERKENFTVRLSKALLREVDRLVDEGEYASRSDLVTRAVTLLVDRDQLAEEMRKEVLKVLREEGLLKG